MYMLLGTGSTKRGLPSYMKRPTLAYSTLVHKADPSSDNRCTPNRWYCHNIQATPPFQKARFTVSPHSNHKQHLPDFCCCVSLVPAPEPHGKRPSVVWHPSAGVVPLALTGGCFLQLNGLPMPDLPLGWTPRNEPLQTFTHKDSGMHAYIWEKRWGTRQVPSTTRRFLRNCKPPGRVPAFGGLSSLHWVWSFPLWLFYVNLSYDEMVPDTELSYNISQHFYKSSVSDLSSFSNILKAGLIIKV